GEFDQALAASQRHLEDETQRDRVQFLLAAAHGDANESRRLLDAFTANYGSARAGLEFLAVQGDRTGANAKAAAADARPLGFLNLATAVGSCNCGAPFDLEVAPNFARFLEEAELPWPPPSPIKWPLKDW
ncbi:MAG: hypothetical protein OEW81_11495, partial [Gammaproteobacteria bacterium]|nr:hypothetical protein [Gammaproteobacteria bacterium]